MSKYNLIILFLCFFCSDAKTQSTADLFSLKGLTIAVNNSDTHIFRTTTFYLKDTIIDDKTHLEYHSQNCFPTFYRIDGFRVYVKDLFVGEDETLIYDFGLNLGDTIVIPLFLDQAFFKEINFFVVAKEVVVFLDGLDRIKLELESDELEGTLEWIEGIGQFNFERKIDCVKDDNGSIYLGVSEEECEKLVCKNIRVDFDMISENNKVVLTNTSENYDELEWDMGDGTLYGGEVVEHNYEGEGCWTIKLTAKNTSGFASSARSRFQYCIDSLWVLQSEKKFVEISMISETEGFAITEDSIFTTNNSVKSWINVPVEFLNDSVRYKLGDLKMSNDYGVIMIENSDVEADVLLTTDRGLTWKEIVIPDLNFKWRQKASIDKDGNIVVGNSSRIFTSTNIGASWEMTRLENGGDAIAITLYQGDDGLVVVSNTLLTVSTPFATQASTIHISTDFGRSFSHTKFDDIVHITGISYSEGTIHICGQGGFKKTADFGSTWEDLPESAFDVYFFDLNNGLIITFKSIKRTNDGGQTWVLENCANYFGLKSLEVIDGLELINHTHGISRYLPEDNYDCLTSLIEMESNNDLKVYPIPSSGSIFISGLKRQIKTIYCFNIHGQFVDVNMNQYHLDIRHLSSGIYILRIEDEAGKFHVVKFVKE